MIKNFYSNDFPNGYETFCQIHVLNGWFRVSAWMVMSANERGTTASDCCMEYSLGWTIATFKEPIEIISLKMRRFFVLRNKQMKCSFCSYLKSDSSRLKTSFGLRIEYRSSLGDVRILASFNIALICRAFPFPLIFINCCSVASISF